MKRGIDVIHAMLRRSRQRMAEASIDELSRLLGEDAWWFETVRQTYRMVDSRTMATILLEECGHGATKSS